MPHGPLPYGACTIAAGHDESSKPAVFQPSGGEAGVPASAFQVPSVTTRVASSCAAAMTLAGLVSSAMPSIAITFVPGTSSDLMSLTCDVCHSFVTVPGALETSVPFTYVLWPSSALTRSTALETDDGSATVNVLRMKMFPCGAPLLAPAVFQIQFAVGVAA